jgi:aminoglycoside phosphotransferase (APT) family kinase protein
MAAKMHADEADIDTDLVRAMVATRFPHWAALPVTPVESAGTVNAMYRLGEDLAVRLPRIASAAEDVIREQTWLPRLAPGLPVAVPEPVGLGEPVEGFPWHWSVCRWLPGTNPAVEDLADPESLATDLAAFITALRLLDPTGGPAQARGVPLANRDAETRAAIDQLRGDVDTDAVTAVWSRAIRLPRPDGPAVWSHGDLSPGNVLIDGGRLAAVIDFGCVGIGDPTVDLIIAWNLLPARARGVFRAALRVDDATWERGRALALSISLIQLPYYRSTNPVLAANSRHVIAEVLTDCSALPQS